MIETLLSGLIQFLIATIQAFLAPIDALILTVFPNVANMIASVAIMFNGMLTGLGWGLSLSAIPPAGFVILAAYWTFALTVPWFFTAWKIFIHWWDALAP